jgi:Barrel-sandwich domain of CusB or HlyD membrane-fusion
MKRLGRWWIAALPVALVVLSGAIWMEHRSVGPSTGAPRVVQPTRRANFAVSVTTTGELRASKFVQVVGPSSQEAQVYQTKITWLAAEGTTVKEGVAELDRAPAETRRQAVLLELQKADGEFTNAVLDSALALAQAREDVRTAEYALEEKRLARAEAEFEAPTLKRQAQIDFEKAGRALDQSKVSLDTKTKQAIAKLSIAAANLERSKHNLQAVEDAIGEFTVRAPSEGMVIYLREYGGRKKGVGSTYYVFDPVVATLPDLTQMQSLTYVNEVDVHRIAVGQPVEISLDAEPSRRLSGRVMSVANVGEQHPNEDAKVFEVVIDIANADTTLRPSMTTANTIQTRLVPNVLTIPLRAITSDAGFSYVYKETGNGVIRQMIETGAIGSTDAVITRGLADTDHVLLDPPPKDRVVQTVRLAGVAPASKR